MDITAFSEILLIHGLRSKLHSCLLQGCDICFIVVSGAGLTLLAFLFILLLRCFCCPVVMFLCFGAAGSCRNQVHQKSTIGILSYCPNMLSSQD